MEPDPRSEQDSRPGCRPRFRARGRGGSVGSDRDSWRNSRVHQGMVQGARRLSGHAPQRRIQRSMGDRTLAGSPDGPVKPSFDRIGCQKSARPGTQRNRPPASIAWSVGLSGTVGTDWDRFVAYADVNDMGSWRRALEWCVVGRSRGSGHPTGRFWRASGRRSRLQSSTSAVGWPGPTWQQAMLGAREWAARRGLLVSPYDERLYRMLMRAADAGGNPAGVEAVMSELIKLVANEIEPLDSVHPSTMDLYRSLTRRRNGASKFV